MAERFLDGKDKLIESPSATRLVIAFHGFEGSPQQVMPLCTIASKEEQAASDYFFPALPISSWFTRQRPEEIIRTITGKVDRIVEKGGGKYASIVICGYSFGALLARGLYLNAWTAAYDGGPKARRDWAPLVRRLVLLSGIERGWSTDSPMSFFLRVWAPLLQSIAVACRVTGLNGMKGAPFLTDLRLGFHELWQSLPPEHVPHVTHLLGTDDDVVAPSDHVDMSGTIHPDHFNLVPIPETNHPQMLQLDVHGLPSQGATWNPRSFRTAVIHDALYGNERVRPAAEDSHWANVCRALAARDHGLVQQDNEVEHVVFVVHGIRDKGFWTHWLASYLQASGGKRIVVETPSYGFFPILPFLLPWTRTRKVEWLLDKYVEARKRYPKARVSFVGHSNGSYLLARSLEITRNTKFDNIVFAGSPVRRSYNWSRFGRKIATEEGRVGGVLNFVASADWVVALFGGGLAPLRRFDLGTAGHLGFTDKGETLDRKVINVRYASGDHGAALKFAVWKDIADFVVHGKVPVEGNALAQPADGGPRYRTDRPAVFNRFLGWMALPALTVLFAIVALPGVTMLAALLDRLGARALWTFAGRQLPDMPLQLAASAWLSPLSSFVPDYYWASYGFLQGHPHVTAAGLLVYAFLLRFLGRRF